MGTQDNRTSKQLMPNVVSNAAYLILNISIGLFIVPYFINELGIAAYGIIPLATSVTSYVVTISSSLSNSTARYLGISMNQGDKDSTVRTYNTALFGLGYVVLAIAPLVVLVALLSPTLFEIGPSAAIDVQILFACVIASMLIASWGTNFQMVLFANNRLDHQNIMKVTQLAVQTGLIITFFTLTDPSLPSVGAAYLIGSITSVIVGYALCRRTCPYLKMKRRLFNMSHFKEICHVGVWTIVSSVGGLLMIQMSMILTNILLGPVLNGTFSIVASMILVLSSLGVTLSSVFAPITYRSFSEERYNDIISTCRSAMKVIGILLALPLAFICVFSPQILTAWVGGEFAHLSEIIWIVFPLFVCFEAATTLTPIGLVYLKVRVPGLATLLFGILNVILIFVFVGYFDMGLRGVALAWAAAMTIRCCIFAPWYYAKVAGAKGYGFLGSLIYGILCFVIGAALCYVVDAVFTIPSSLIALAVTAFVLMMIYIVTVPNILLSRGEKKLVRSCLPASVESRLPKWFL